MSFHCGKEMLRIFKLLKNIAAHLGGGQPRGVDPYGTGGHVPPIFGLGDIITNAPPQYLDWGTLSRMSPSIFLE